MINNKNPATHTQTRNTEFKERNITANRQYMLVVLRTANITNTHTTIYMKKSNHNLNTQKQQTKLRMGWKSRTPGSTTNKIHHTELTNRQQTNTTNTNTAGTWQQNEKHNKHITILT